MKRKNIEKIREFNRFYTTYLGVLDRKFLGTEYTLTEGRIIVEIGSNSGLTAKEISDRLNIDQGYLSRIISRYLKNGVIDRTTSKKDSRFKILTLTDAGYELYKDLNKRSDLQLNYMLQGISKEDEDELILSINSIYQILNKKTNQVVFCKFHDYEREITSIRETVFVKEQNVPKELELDGLDTECDHVLVKCRSEFVATGRMQKDGHIGRVAVLKNFRGKGLGKEIILSLIEVAKSKGLGKVYLGAQLTAKKFYQKLGFKQYGEIFLDAGIKHIMMDLRI